MEEYVRRHERMGETTEAAVEVGVGNGALKSIAPEVTDCCPRKRRKISSQCSNDGNEISLENSVSLATSAASVHEPVTSKCSSSESSESVKDIWSNLDLKYEDFVTDNAGSMNNGFSRETTPSSDLCGDLVAEMESSSSKAKKKSQEEDSSRAPDAGKMPSAAEIEEFFSVTEKYVQNRFAEKYNYDVVKDVPLEGRYQWVRFKP